MSNPEYNKSVNEYVECTCPKCGITHTIYMFWTGTCSPRKYCREHKKVAGRICEVVPCLSPFTENGRQSPKPADQGKVSHG